MPFSDAENLATRRILRYLSEDETFVLADTVSQRTAKPKTLDHAVALIVRFSKSFEELLNRKKMKREFLARYALNNRVEGCDGKGEKRTIVRDILRFTGSRIDDRGGTIGATKGDKGTLAALIARGVCQIKTDAPRQAIDDFEQALQIDPRCLKARTLLSETLMSYGSQLMEEGDLDAAKDIYSQVILLEPSRNGEAPAVAPEEEEEEPERGRKVAPERKMDRASRKSGDAVSNSAATTSSSAATKISVSIASTKERSSRENLKINMSRRQSNGEKDRMSTNSRKRNFSSSSSRSAFSSSTCEEGEIEKTRSSRCAKDDDDVNNRLDHSLSRVRSRRRSRNGRSRKKEERRCHYRSCIDSRCIDSRCRSRNRRSRSRERGSRSRRPSDSRPRYRRDAERSVSTSSSSTSTNHRQG